MEAFGKILFATGLLLACVGAAFWVFGRGGGGFLPGDIVIERRSGRFYFPIVTCIGLSVLLSVAAWLWRR